MWEVILKSVIGTIIKTTFFTFLRNKDGKRKIQEHKNSLSEYCEKVLKKFDNTSLDCGSFYEYVESSYFKDFLYKYFNIPYDGFTTTDLIDKVVDDVNQKHPKCNKQDLNEFFKTLDEIYRKYLHEIVENDVALSALWNLLTITNRKFYQIIFENEKNLTSFIKSYSSPKQEIESSDLSTYHETCIKEFSKICFSGIANAETKSPKTIEDLYVENRFVVISDFLNEKIKRDVLLKKRKRSLFDQTDTSVYIDNISGLAKLSNRIVLVGGAGFGKTTTVNYLFCKYKEIFGSDILRIKINLKDYSNEIDQNKDIFDFLLSEISKRTQRSKQKNLNDILAKYIEEGNALIIFDALDEISSESVREKAREAINSFVNLYHLNNYIITTREVGYLKNKFDESFLHVRICPFDDQQVKKYSENWYNQKNEAEREENGNFDDFYERFSEEVEKSKCSELIKNPIILVLALIIFDASNNLPHKRVEFYKKCIETFLNTREERKGAFHFPDQAKNILGNSATIPMVAYYRYKKMLDDPEYKFTKEELHKFILQSLEVTEETAWMDAVNVYTKYLIERTELIREIDENVFDFSHKTFNEYFLACYFANNIENDKLIKLLKEWIGDPNKDELANLVIEVIIQQNQKQQHEAVINMLFDNIYELRNNIYDSKIHNDFTKRYRKLSDYLKILYNIVLSEMLLPKFIDKFYALLIDYPDMIRADLLFNMGINIFIISRLINSDRYIEISANKYKKDQNVLNMINRSLFFLNNIKDEREYLSIRSEFIKKHELTDDIIYIIDLFYKTYKTPFYKEETEEKPVEFVKFINIIDKNKQLFSSNNIYLLIVNLLCRNEENEKHLSPEWVANFKITKNDMFENFIGPDALVILLNNVFNNEIWFLINFLSYAYCTNSSAFFYLDYIEDNYKDYDDEKEKTKDPVDIAVSNAHIIKRLFALETEEEFMYLIKSKNVYNAVFDNIYKSLFAVCKEYYMNNIKNPRR